MARKQYQSIVRLLEHSGIDIDSPLQLSRIKKQLLAEFDFSGSGFIEADGYSYSKADTLEELDNPDFEARYTYHRRIWHCKAILCMLEDNAFNYHDFSEQLKAFNNDVVFDEFFSPWFSVSFSYVLRSYVNDQRFEDAGDLLLFEEFLLGTDREEAFRPLRVFLDEQLRLFRNINDQNYESFRPQIQPWIESYWSRLINHLPAELIEKKSEISFYLVNLTVAIQKTHKKDCRKISQELTCVTELSSDLTHTIINNHKVYTHRGSGTNYGWIIWAVLILFRVLSGC